MMFLASDEKPLDEDGFDGIIVLGRISAPLLQTLNKYTKNLVGIWRNPIHCEIDEIVCDGRKAAHMAIQVLTDRIQHGHTEKMRVEFPCRLAERESVYKNDI